MSEVNTKPKKQNFWISSFLSKRRGLRSLIISSYISTVIALLAIALHMMWTSNNKILEPDLPTGLTKEQIERINGYVRNSAYISDRIRHEVNTVFAERIIVVNAIYGLILALIIPVGSNFFLIYLGDQVKKQIQKDADDKMNPILQEGKECIKILNSKKEELENITSTQARIEKNIAGIEKRIADFTPISQYVMADNNKSAKNQALLNHIASQLPEEELSRLIEGVLVEKGRGTADINQIKQEIKEKLEEKIEWLKRFSEVSWKDYVNIGNQFAQEEFYEKALECYEEALKRSQGNYKVHYKIGSSQFCMAKKKSGKEQVELLYTALASLEKACELCSGKSCPEVWYEHGNVAGHIAELLEKVAKKDYYEKAIESYDKAIRQEPNNADLYFAKGEAFSKLSNYIEAEKAFQRAVDIDSSISWYWRHYADSLASQGKHQKSIDSYRKSISLSDGSIDNKSDNYYWAQYSLGDALRKSIRIHGGNEIGLDEAILFLNEAISCYKEAFRCNPSLTEIYYRLGRTYASLGQVHHLKQNKQEAINNYWLAVSSYKEAIKFKNSALSRLHLAFVQRQLISLGEQSISLKEESEDNFDTALRVLDMQENDSHLTLYNKARWYALHFIEQSNDIDRVIDYLDKAIHKNRCCLNWVEGESDFDFVWEQPKFQEWLQRVGREAS